MNSFRSGRRHARNSSLSLTDRKAQDAQGSVLETHKELHKSWDDAVSSSSALPDDIHRPSKVFSHSVSGEVVVGGVQKIWNWRKPLTDKVGGVTPSPTANVLE